MFYQIKRTVERTHVLSNQTYSWKITCSIKSNVQLKDHMFYQIKRTV